MEGTKKVALGITLRYDRMYCISRIYDRAIDEDQKKRDWNGKYH